MARQGQGVGRLRQEQRDEEKARQQQGRVWPSVNQQDAMAEGGVPLMADDAAMQQVPGRQAAILAATLYPSHSFRQP